MSLQGDPRWQRFTDDSYRCECCGEPVNGPFDLAVDHPDPWPHGDLRSTGGEELRVGKDVLTADLCRYNGHFYIRCVLPIPIVGAAQVFAYGPWANIARKDFERYASCSTSGDFTDFAGCFGWLMNKLPGWDINHWLPCDVMLGDPELRPNLHVHGGEHPIAEAQVEGITFDRLLELYAAAGQDVGAHL